MATIGRGVGDEAFLVEPCHHRGLHVEFGGGEAVAQPGGDEIERPVLDAIQALGRGAVGLEAVDRPQRLELLDEIAGRHDGSAAVVYQLDRAGVDARHVRDGGARRILHRDDGAAAEDLAQPGLEFEPAGVGDGGGRQVGQGAALDLVDEGARLAAGRHEIEPAPRGHVAGRTEARDAPRHRVRAVKVVEQPPIETGCAEGRLHGGYVKGHTRIEYSWFGWFDRGRRQTLRSTRAADTQVGRIAAGDGFVEVPRPARGRNVVMNGPAPSVDRRAVLQILAALGFGAAAATDLAAQARPVVSRAVLQQVATLLDGGFDAARLGVAERAVQRNQEHMAAMRELVLDDAVEPAPIFAPRR